jgi:hypothetical protein
VVSFQAEKTVLPVWEKSPDANYSTFVDNVELFSFIKSIKEESKWIFPFDSVHDIIDILKIQFAHLMSRGIELLNKTSKADPIIEKLSGIAFKLAVEKRDGWQGYLFAELLSQEVDKRIEKRIAYNLNINVGIGEYILDADISKWILTNNDEVKRFVIGLTNIINEFLKEALATEDIHKLFHSTMIIGNIYEEAIDWALRVRKYYVNDNIKDLQQVMSFLLEDSYEQIEGLPNLLRTKIDKALSGSSPEDFIIQLTVKIELKNEVKWKEELDCVMKYLSNQKLF